MSTFSKVKLLSCDAKWPFAHDWLFFFDHLVIPLLAILTQFPHSKVDIQECHFLNGLNKLYQQEITHKYKQQTNFVQVFLFTVCCLLLHMVMYAHD